MTTKKQIDDFFNSKKIAFAGLSRNPKSFSRSAFRTLSESGIDLYPVNPNADEIEKKMCYSNVNQLPDDINNLIIMTSKENSADVLRDALDKGIRNIWLQQSCETQETKEIMNETNANIISKECILMFAEPVTGVHKFHRFFIKFFGLYPK